MRFLPDTNFWIRYLKNAAGAERQRLERVQPSDIGMCSVVQAELLHGAEKYGNRERRREILRKLFQPYVSLPFDDLAATHYGELRHRLETLGEVIGPYDLQIAAIALAHGLTLVSSNTNEFQRVSGLRVEDWSQPLS